MSAWRQSDDLFPGNSTGPWRTWTLAAIFVAALASVGGELVAWACVEGLKRAGLFPAALWAQATIAIVLVFGTAIALLVLWLRYFERKAMASVGWGPAAARGLLRGMLLGAGFLCAVVALLAGSGGARLDHPGALAHASLTNVVAAALLALAFLIQGSAEEFIFRGWLMQVTASRYGKVIAVATSTALFTLAHAANIKLSPELVLGLVNVFLFGTFLAVYAIRTRSLWGPCGWHAAWNWLMSVGFGLNLSGMNLGIEPFLLDMKLDANGPWWLSGGSFGPEGSVMTTAVMAASVAFWWIAGYKQR